MVGAWRQPRQTLEGNPSGLGSGEAGSGDVIWSGCCRMHTPCPVLPDSQTRPFGHTGLRPGQPPGAEVRRPMAGQVDWV
jgi:hypothetical protein